MIVAIHCLVARDSLTTQNIHAPFSLPRMLLWTSCCPSPTTWSDADLSALWSRFREAAPRQTSAPARIASRRQRLNHAVDSGTVYSAAATASIQSTGQDSLIATT